MRRIVLSVLGSAALLLLAACGGDGEDEGDAANDTSNTEAQSPTATTEAPSNRSETDSDPEEASPSPEDAESSPPAIDSEFLGSLEGFIVFSSERGDEENGPKDDLYIMNADGSDARRLTESERNEWWPQISPDGGTLLFGGNYPGESRTVRSGHSAWGIFLWESGGEPVDLTDNRQFQASARLSPDGSRILFTSGRGSRASFEDGLYQLGETNVWVMNRDGSDAVQLSENDGSTANWSPDGSEIVFSGVADGSESRDIFIMNADGANLRQISDDESNNSRPAWSPDGSQIVFDSDRDGDREIFVMDADGSNVLQLTDNDAEDQFARWSPDGRALVFTTDRDGNSEIYVVAADGSSEANISNNEAFDAYPSWSAVPFEQ